MRRFRSALLMVPSAMNSTTLPMTHRSAEQPARMTPFANNLSPG